MLRFEMSGQRFEFDPDPVLITAAELFAAEDVMGVPLEDVMDLLASGFEGRAVTGRALKAVCLIAWVAHLRGGGRLEWVAFTRTVAPATLRLIDDEPAPGVSWPVAAVVAAGDDQAHPGPGPA